MTIALAEALRFLLSLIKLVLVIQFIQVKHLPLQVV